MKSQRSAALPWLNGKAPHLPCAIGELPEIVLFPGDPGRVDMFSSLLDDFRLIGQNREFRVGVGTFEGVRLGVCSTGIGGPSTEIALVEAAELGCRIALRVGGCGAIQREIPVGSLLVVSHAIRGGGAASFYSDTTAPAAANAHLVRTLSCVAEEQRIQHSVVTVVSTDSYYAGQGRRYPNSPEDAVEKLKSYRALGAAAVDMEAETVLVVGDTVGMISGALLAVHGNRVTDEWLDDFETAQMQMLRVACIALTRKQQARREDY